MIETTRIYDKSLEYQKEYFTDLTTKNYLSRILFKKHILSSKHTLEPISKKKKTYK